MFQLEKLEMESVQCAARMMDALGEVKANREKDDDHTTICVKSGSGSRSVGKVQVSEKHTDDWTGKHDQISYIPSIHKIPKIISTRYQCTCRLVIYEKVKYYADWQLAILKFANLQYYVDRFHCMVCTVQSTEQLWGTMIQNVVLWWSLSSENLCYC